MIKVFTYHFKRWYLYLFFYPFWFMISLDKRLTYHIFFLYFKTKQTLINLKKSRAPSRHFANRCRWRLITLQLYQSFFIVCLRITLGVIPWFRCFWNIILIFIPSDVFYWTVTPYLVSFRCARRPPLIIDRVLITADILQRLLGPHGICQQ